MWKYPSNTAFARCLYLSFYELFEESRHGTLCQNIALLSKSEREFSIEVIFTVNIMGSNSWNMMSDLITEGFSVEVLSQTKLSKRWGGGVGVGGFQKSVVYENCTPLK